MALALKTAMTYLPPFSEIKYFLRCIAKRFPACGSERVGRGIVIMESCLPEEMVYACRKIPHWILGGSLQMEALADYTVPRNTDPVGRLRLGFEQLVDEREDMFGGG